MNKYYEPNTELPWEIYLDFLADQGFDDLRYVPIHSLVDGCDGGLWYTFNREFTSGTYSNGEGYCLGVGEAIIHCPFLRRIKDLEGCGENFLPVPSEGAGRL